ncbi:hypothetical protein [Deinococcus aquiradiocola]|uniref:Uncharacterized protein n=1 Tax=Deinococcus aquiradiocola TaxID=393059 RepID=A0A917PHM5_9DEIO|nr:hypothetical protein [Deinococcus aquiradiocola]GGJ79166.1 hypothetical protein GCM10008939_23730 [Deinococcus aquiradiocola]
MDYVFNSYSPSSDSLSELVDSGVYDNFVFLYPGPIGSYFDIISNSSALNEVFIEDKIFLVENAISNYNSKIPVTENDIRIKFSEEGRVKISILANYDSEGMSVADFYTASNYLLELIGKIRNGKFTHKEVPEIAQDIYIKSCVLNDLIAVFEIMPFWKT